MNPRVKSIRSDSDDMEAAEIMAKYNLLSLPVVDDDHKLLGIITVDDTAGSASALDQEKKPLQAKMIPGGGGRGGKNSFFTNLVIFLSILGPGIITGSVDNDAGGITTYSVAGAHYGYRLLWTLLPAFVVLLVVQEMNARMGIVTGKGLADLIRENFGVKITFFIFVGLLIADIGNTATEFAGVAGSMQIFGVSKYISVPLAAVAVWILVVKGTYKIAERIFLVFSVLPALLRRLGRHGQARLGRDRPGDDPALRSSSTAAYLGMVIGIIGTTIAPWMQFYMQSAVIEKRIKIEDYNFAVWDVVIGCVATVVVAFFIIVACAATLHENGIVINEAKDAAMALKPLAGRLRRRGLRLRPVRGLDLLGHHPAAGHGLLCLRGLRLRGRHRQEAARRRRSSMPCSRRSS